MSDHRRAYSESEHAAFKAVSRREWRQPYHRNAGPAQHAGGDYWPKELRRRAREFTTLIAKYNLAADALEREIAADPRCTPDPQPTQQPGGDEGAGAA